LKFFVNLKGEKASVISSALRSVENITKKKIKVAGKLSIRKGIMTSVITIFFICHVGFRLGNFKLNEDWSDF